MFTFKNWIGLVVGLVLGLGFVSVVQAAPILFGADLRPESEVGPFIGNALGDPGANSDASGVALASFDPATNEFTIFDMVVQGILQADLLDLNPGSGIGTLHLHDGDAGENGPILLNIAFVADFTEIGDTLDLRLVTPLTFDPTSLDRLLAGKTYLNLHTNDFQQGEIRGQFFPDPDVIPEPVTVALILGGIFFGVVAAHPRRHRPWA